jgi:GGDEF domain-containing protein
MSMKSFVETLQEEIKRLKEENDRLRYNDLGVMTRQAAAVENERNWYSGPRYVVMLDINYLKKLNDAHGQATVDEFMKRAFQVRDDDLFFAFNNRSGDEYGFVLKGDPDKFIARLEQSLTENYLSAMMAWEEITDNDLFAAAERGMAKVYEMKRARGIEGR